LYLNHLVLKGKEFTYVELNRRINQFKYLGNDANNKPCEVNPRAGKLSGHAVQNWCFLRMLPLLIGDKIKSPGESEVWQLILQLREIVELVCAQTISTGQVAYLRVLIDEYLYIRKQTFADHPLKPKHHYLNHYPELIVQFGPLIRLWTLRFESKHTYFKQCARRLHNFKNLCGTLAKRHQLLQSFLSAGTLFPPSVVVEKGTEFIVGDYNDKIRQSVAHLHFDHLNTLISHDVTVKGTTYKSNMFVVVGHNDDGLVVGKIKKAVIHNNSAVYFITEVYQAVRQPEINAYHTSPMQEAYYCVSQAELLDHYPLPEYSVWGMSLLTLHHSVPTF